MGPQDFQTSFIPKKPIVESRPQKKAPVSLFTFIATILFIASLVAAGGVFFYNSYLERQITAMNDQLARARDAFEPAVIADLQMLDKRLTASRQVLSSHQTISPLFLSLQEMTLRTVRFTRMELVRDTEGTPNVMVKLSGEAQDYRQIALQADMFSRNKYMKDPMFSNLKLSSTGTVLFDLEFIVDPLFLSYAEQVNRQSAQ